MGRAQRDCGALRTLRQCSVVATVLVGLPNRRRPRSSLLPAGASAAGPPHASLPRHPSGSPRAAAAMAAPAEQDAEGLYCSTAGTYFESREDLTEHQRSDFHRWVRLLRRPRWDDCTLFVFKLFSLKTQQVVLLRPLPRQSRSRGCAAQRWRCRRAGAGSVRHAAVPPRALARSWQLIPAMLPHPSRQQLQPEAQDSRAAARHARVVRSAQSAAAGLGGHPRAARLVRPAHPPQVLQRKHLPGLHTVSIHRIQKLREGWAAREAASEHGPGVL